MAQPIQVSPIQSSGGNGIEYLGQSINSIVKAKQAREQAIRDAIQKQKETNFKIFGDTQEQLRAFHKSANNVPIEERDKILSSGVRNLTQYINDPNFAYYAQQIAGSAYQVQSKWNEYFGQVDEAAKELSKQYGMREDVIKSYAYKNMFDYPNGYPELKNSMSFGDIKNGVYEEALAHPNLYMDKGKMLSSAYADLDKFVGKPVVKQNETTLDTTGMKVSTLGTKYSTTMFDKEVEDTDKTTGFKYSKPVLDTEDYIGDIKSPSGGNYKVLSTEKYDMLDQNASPSIKAAIMDGALERMKEHNVQFFKRLGYGDSGAKTMADSVSIQNSNQYKEFQGKKGFVDPFSEENVELFQRIYAADFLKNSGRYNKDGVVADLSIDKSVKADNQRQPKTERQAADEQYIKAFDEIKSIALADSNANKEWTPIISLPDYAQNVVLEEAKKSLGSKTTIGDFKITVVGEDPWLTTAKDIVDEEGNVKVGKDIKFKKLTSLGVDVRANQPLGPKKKSAVVAAQEQKSPKEISVEEFRKMSISERNKFLQSGGTYK